MSFEWRGEQALDAIIEAVDSALMTCAADLQSKSVDRAPIDTGKLRESCVVDDSEMAQHTVKVGYSTEVNAYSLVQHERLDFNHPIGGGPKYLENPFNENSRRYVEYMGERIEEAIK